MKERESVVIPIPLGNVNVYLLRGTRSIIVDTGYPGKAAAILEKLSENGIDPKEISLILLTHGHIDHYGSAVELKERTDAPVAIHCLDAEFLRKGLNPPLQPTGILGRLLLLFLALKGAAKVPPFEPDILIEGEMNLEAFSVDGKVIPTPGHTPGSVSITLSGGEVVVGDLLMGGIRKSQPNYPLFADDIAQVRESIKLIMQLSPTRIYSGHGGPFDPEAILRKFS